MENAEKRFSLELGTDNWPLTTVLNCGPRPATSGRVKRHKLNVVRRQRGFHAHGAGARSVGVCCASLRHGGADLEEISEHLCLENGPCMSPRTPHQPRWAATIADALVFLSTCRGALKKTSEGVAFAPRINLASLQRFIANPGSGTQKSVPRLRDRMQERRALAQARKRLRLCISCATRTIVVQIRGKAGPYATAAKCSFAERTSAQCVGSGSARPRWFPENPDRPRRPCRRARASG